MVGEHQTDRVKVKYQVGMECWWNTEFGQRAEIKTDCVVRWVSKYKAFLSGKET